MPPSTAEVLATLKDAYPRERIERSTLVVYVHSLRDIPGDVLAAIVQEIIDTSPWFPSVAAIRERAAERSLRLPGEAEALAQIDARMRWIDAGGEGDPPPVHHVVRQALKAVGGWYAFRSADATVIRGQFGRLYRELRAGTVSSTQRAALGPSRREIQPPGRSST